MAAASTRSLSIIGAPTSAGAYGPGPGRTPCVFREHRLVTVLRDSGIDVVDRGDGRTAPWQPDDDNPTARNVDTVVAIATELADSVAAAFGWMGVAHLLDVPGALDGLPRCSAAGALVQPRAMNPKPGPCPYYWDDLLEISHGASSPRGWSGRDSCYSVRSRRRRVVERIGGHVVGTGLHVLGRRLVDVGGRVREDAVFSRRRGERPDQVR
jgi:hypothetical protein